MSITINQVRAVGDEELLELSHRNPGYQIERDRNGALIVSPTGSQSGRRSLDLGAQLHTWAAKDGTGLAFDSSTGFRLPDGSVLSPDASWVQCSRWNALSAGEQESFAPLCPDAVFEIRSKSDSPARLRAKMQLYIENGALLAVLIDPYERSVEFFRPGQPPAVHHAAASLALDPELPGFALDAAAICEV